MQPWWTISFLLSNEITHAKDCYGAWLQADWLLKLFFTQCLYKDPHASRGLREEVEVYWLVTAGSPHHWTSPHRTALYMTHFQIFKMEAHSWRPISFNINTGKCCSCYSTSYYNTKTTSWKQNNNVKPYHALNMYREKKQIINPLTRQVLHYMAVCGIYYTKASYINELPWLEFQTASLAGVPQRGQRERERSMWHWLQLDPVESWWTAWGPTTQWTQTQLCSNAMIDQGFYCSATALAKLFVTCRGPKMSMVSYLDAEIFVNAQGHHKTNWTNTILTWCLTI